MAAPYLNAWNPAAIAASHTALLALLDAHETDPAYITVHDAADVLLGTITLDKPAGTIDGGTGALDLIEAAREETAVAGTASYATLHDGAGTAYQSLPCEAGTEAVLGKCVLNTLTIVAGGPIELVGWVIV